jgi:hypothetical protein
MMPARREEELDLAQVRAILPGSALQSGSGRIGSGCHDALHLVHDRAVAGNPAAGNLHKDRIAVVGDVLNLTAPRFLKKTRRTESLVFSLRFPP